MIFYVRAFRNLYIVRIRINILFWNTIHTHKHRFKLQIRTNKKTSWRLIVRSHCPVGSPTFVYVYILHLLMIQKLPWVFINILIRQLTCVIKHNNQWSHLPLGIIKFYVLSYVQLKRWHISVFQLITFFFFWIPTVEYLSFLKHFSSNVLLSIYWCYENSENKSEFSMKFILEWLSQHFDFMTVKSHKT